MNPNRPTERHIIIKMGKVKNKEMILKAARLTQSIDYKGTLIKLLADFYRPEEHEKIYSDSKRKKKKFAA